MFLQTSFWDSPTELNGQNYKIIYIFLQHKYKYNDPVKVHGLKAIQHIPYGYIKAYESGWDILTTMIEVHGVEGDVVILLLYTD